MDPEKIARRLLAFARVVEPQDVGVSSVPGAAEDTEMWRREFRLDDDIAAPLWEIMGTLKMALDETDWDPDVSDIPQAERDRWTFGEALTLRGSPRDIVRGFLQPLRVEPMLRRVPDSIALYLISIDDGEDFLKRENHNMGWHYHYMNWRKDRSNVILSWDTRWRAPGSHTKPARRRGLFVEPHGERGADFTARPDLWGPKKRISMYDACSSDLATWPIDEFKCASNDSNLVYPPAATLTPHPVAVAAAVAKASATAKTLKKRRR
ncbi:hypothetical protein QTN93_13245 [Sphingomonas aerolata]|uniref:hypothetical protein n=1 Tax=Sphingomonas aerolata TaxID=185951 RepID=UPI0035A57284